MRRLVLQQKKSDTHSTCLFDLSYYHKPVPQAYFQRSSANFDRMPSILGSTSDERIDLVADTIKVCAERQETRRRPERRIRDSNS